MRFTWAEVQAHEAKIFAKKLGNKNENNSHTHDSGQAAKLECDSGNGALVAQEVQGRAGVRFLVRIESVRSRLLDEDNLCEKYHVDLLRYSGVIPDDAPGKTKIEVSQRKAIKDEDEHIVIEVSEI